MFNFLPSFPEFEKVFYVIDMWYLEPILLNHMEFEKSPIKDNMIIHNEMM